jgi:hypothetical protein
MRVNGVDASRAVLEAGDVFELGEVRFRFLPPQGAHSLNPVPQDDSDQHSPRSSRKPLFVVSLIGLLALAGAGAVLATVRGFPGTLEGDQASSVPMRGAVTVERAQPSEPRPARGAEEPIDEPQEWEGQLARARRALARGRFDRAYSIADELPADSILRNTPEFGEIRYRYAQAHITEGQRALAEGNLAQARDEAELVLGLERITSKQRQDAKRLMRSARETQPTP